MVTIDWFEGSREALTDLFRLADDSPAQVQGYRELGRVLVARDGPKVVGHLQLVGPGRADAAEVKSLAVHPDRQRLGIGRRLVERAVAACRDEHRSSVLVGTAAADTRVLRFYQRVGFRFLSVERDAFSPSAGYPVTDIDGIPLRDRVWLSLTLSRGEDPAAQVRATQLRVARHTERLEELVSFYRDGLGLPEIGGFRDHDGYEGVFLA